MTRFTPPSDRTAPSLHATTDSKRVISMPIPFSRRRLLQWAAAGTAAPALLGPLQAWAQGAGLHFGPAQPFSFDALIQTAAQMAGQPYEPPYRPAPAVVHQIDDAAPGNTPSYRTQK